MEELRKKIWSNLKDHSGPVIAVGMSEYKPYKDTTVSEVFKRADNLMYSDKQDLKSAEI